MTRWSIIGALLLICVSSALVLANKFPGQPLPKRTFFPPTNPQEYKPKTVDLPALTFDVRIDMDRYPGGVPEVLPLTIVLTEPLRGTWKIVRVDGYEQSTSGENRLLYPGPYLIPSDFDYRVGAFWQDLKRNGVYTLKVFLFAKSKNADVREASKVLGEEKGIIVTDEPEF